LFSELLTLSLKTEKVLFDLLLFSFLFFSDLFFHLFEFVVKGL